MPQEELALGLSTIERHMDHLLDEALEATFPASDPISIFCSDRHSHPPVAGGVRGSRKVV